MSYGQTGIPAVYLRTGTSKGMFFKEEDVPPPGPLRDRVMKRIMGTPDQIQIDGMGGARIVTSKVAIIGTSDREDADVDYTYAQVSIAEDSIRFKGNCGNISAGVGPFAIDEGLIKKPFRKGYCTDPSILMREVRIYQTAIKKILVAHVPIHEKTGKSLSKGDCAIDGVPGTGAPILIDFRDTIGGFFGRGMLPTGNLVDILQIGETSVRVTIADVATLAIFIEAADLGVGNLKDYTGEDITNDEQLIARCKEVRGKSAQLLGMCSDWKLVDEQSIGMPAVVLIAPPSGRPDAHITSRFILNNLGHDSMAGTVSACTAACSRLPGSLVHSIVGEKALREDVFNISHPRGILPVTVQAATQGQRALTVSLEEPTFNTLAIRRTSRRIMEGRVFVPDDVWDGVVTNPAAEGKVNGMKDLGLKSY